MPSGTIINHEAYCDLLENQMKSSIRSKYYGLLSSSVLLHRLCATAQQIKDLSFKYLLPLVYSPDLEIRDYHVSGPFKEVLSGNKFRMDDEINEAVHRWL